MVSSLSTAIPAATPAPVMAGTATAAAAEKEKCAEANTKEIASTTLTSLGAAIVSQSVIDKILASPKKVEHKIERISKLIFRIAMSALTDYEKGKYTSFDPLVGDEACERRALKIYALACDSDFRSEVAQLKEKLIETEKKVGLLNQLIAKAAKRSSSSNPIVEFYAQQIGVIQISDNMTYLMQAAALTSMKTYKHKFGAIVYSHTGAEEEVNEPNQMVIQYRIKNADCIQEYVKKGDKTSEIKDHLKSELKKRSLSYVKDVVVRIEKAAVIPLAETVVMQEMLSATYRCYHDFKTVMMRLCEYKAVLILKRMIPLVHKPKKGAAPTASPTPMRLIYQISPKGNVLERIAEASLGSLIGKPAVVLEAAIVANITEDQLAARIEQEGGLLQVALANAAIIDEPDEINNAAAKKEVEAYQIIAQKMGYQVTRKPKLSITNPFMLVDHVYCETLAKEGDTNAGK